MMAAVSRAVMRHLKFGVTSRNDPTKSHVSLWVWTKDDIFPYQKSRNGIDTMILMGSLRFHDASTFVNCVGKGNTFFRRSFVIFFRERSFLCKLNRFSYQRVEHLTSDCLLGTNEALKHEDLFRCFCIATADGCGSGRR
jgi:hypothetical protein